MDRLAVLYAEDNANDIELAQRHLRRHAAHIQLQAAATARECLQRLENEVFDAVLLDFRLPDRDGLELLHEIRERSLPVAVIMLTGSGDPETAAAAIKGGAFDYLVKQSDYLERLPAAVENAVRLFRSAQQARERIRILYAEHSVADAELTLRHCRLRAPYLDFDVVADGKEALERLSAARYDVILLDYKLPDLDGVALVSAITNRRPGAPCVLITGQGDEGSAVAALKAGAYDYIVKREGYLYRLPSALEHVLSRYRLAEEKAILEGRVTERTRELLQANQRLAALATVAARIQRRLDRATLFATLSAEVKGLGWESCIILATQEGAAFEVAHLSLRAEARAQVEALVGPLNTLRMRPERDSAFAQIFLDGRARFVDNALERLTAILCANAGSAQPEEFAEVGRRVGIGASTHLVAAPLVTEGGLRGALAVWGDNVYESDLPAVAAFAGQTAVAIENAGLHERLRARRLEEQAVLLQLSGELLSTLFPQEVMERSAAAAARVLRADSAAVLLPLADGSALELHAAAGAGAERLCGQQVPASEDTAEGLALRTRVPARAGGEGLAPHLPAAAFREFGLQSGMAVPLISGEQVLGVLSVQCLALRSFDEDDERVVSLIAGQAAVALERARLYVAEQRRSAQLSVIREVGQDIMAVLDPGQLLQHVADLICKRFRYAYVDVMLVDEERHELVLRARSPSGKMAAQVVRVGIGREGLTGWVAQHGEPLLVNDVSRDERFLFAGDSPDVRSELAVPIAVRGHVLGVLDVAGTCVNAFGSEDLFIMQALAQQMAVALENARLYEETRRRADEVSTLLDTAAAISAPLALDVRLRAIAQRARHLVSADACSVYRLVQNAGELLLLQPLVSLDAQDRARSASAVRPGEGVTGRVAETRKGEIAQVPWYPGPAWMVSVPLISGDETIGVMTLVRENGLVAFGSHDLDLLSTFAVQAALAIQNAELVETLQARAQTLQSAYDRLAEADKLKDQLVQNISHELRTPLTFLKGYVDLLGAEDLGPLTGEQRESLRIIALKTDTIIRLVDDVVTLQALNTTGLHLQAVDVNDLARQAAGVMRPSAERASLRLRCEWHAEQAPARIDPPRIEQVLDSLLSNAIKFSPGGGDITLRVYRDDAFVTIEVEDRGVGIPQDKLERIFERFYQADGSTTRRFGGVGLGLAIVKLIVDMHGGRVEVESQPGKGSLFRVLLPAA